MGGRLTEYRLRCETVGHVTQLTVVGGHFGTEDNHYPNDSEQEQVARLMLSDLRRVGQEASGDVVLVVESAGIGGHDPYRPLLRLYQELRRRGHRLAVVLEPFELASCLRELLSVTDLDRVISVYATAAAAHAALGREAEPGAAPDTGRR